MKRVVWLSGLVPFEQAAEIMVVVGRVDMSKSSVWRQVQIWGAGFRQEQERERERANVAAGPRLQLEGGRGQKR